MVAILAFVLAIVAATNAFGDIRSPKGGLPAPPSCDPENIEVTQRMISDNVLISTGDVNWLKETLVTDSTTATEALESLVYRAQETLATSVGGAILRGKDPSTCMVEQAATKLSTVQSSGEACVQSVVRAARAKLLSARLGILSQQMDFAKTVLQTTDCCSEDPYDPIDICMAAKQQAADEAEAAVAEASGTLRQLVSSLTLESQVNSQKILQCTLDATQEANQCLAATLSCMKGL